jgi:putative redox protein
MANEETVTAQVQETGESAYAVSITVSGHVIKGDEPTSFGGSNLGPAPYDLLLAALGECTAMTVRWYALKHNWPLTQVEVRLSYRKEDATEMPQSAPKSGKVDVFEKQVIVHGDKLTQEQRAKLVEIAAKCPVQRTLQSDVVIRTF